MSSVCLVIVGGVFMDTSVHEQSGEMQDILDETLTSEIELNWRIRKRLAQIFLSTDAASAVNTCLGHKSVAVRTSLLPIAAWLIQQAQLDGAELLTEMTGLVVSVERVFLAAILDPKPCSVLIGWRAERGRQENVEVLEYLIKQAVKYNTMIKCDNEMVRLVDYRLQSQGQLSAVSCAAQLDRLDVLRILLRHGAGLHGAQQDMCRQRHTGRSDIAQILQRAGLLRQHSVPTLKHLCRCAIRRRLSLVWQLPSGITSLPVPTSVHVYLDLGED